MAAIDNKVVTVDDSITELLVGAPGGTSWAIHNASGATLYIGADDVTADTTAGTGGFPIPDGEKFSGELEGKDSLSGRLASGSGPVHVLWN